MAEAEDGMSGNPDTIRRGLILGAAGALAASTAMAQSSPPPEGASEGSIQPGRGSVLQGKVAVVTGAARGIGRAIAVEMAANGADIVALDICGPVSPSSDAKPADRADLDETARRIQAFGRRCTPVQADIRDIGRLRQVAADTVRDHGKIDIVVANAAIQYWSPLLDMKDSDWRDVIEVNVNGTANTVRAFAPPMVERKYGRFILLSSMQGKHGTRNASSYSASKWAILGLMKSAALELGEHRITVNALIPGLVDTPLTRYTKRFRNSIAESQPNPPDNPTAEQAWATRAPLEALKAGWLQPEDISPAAVFLASDAAAMVTGAEYEVTGGDSAKDI